MGTMRRPKSLTTCSSEGSRCWSLFRRLPATRPASAARFIGSAAVSARTRADIPDVFAFLNPNGPDEGRARAGREPLRRPRGPLLVLLQQRRALPDQDRQTETRRRTWSSRRAYEGYETFP